MKNRHGSYKKILISAETLKRESDFLSSNLERLFLSNLTPFELTTLYLILFLRIKHPRNWLQKKVAHNSAKGPINARELMEIIPREFNLSNWEKEKLSGVSADLLFIEFRLKGIPEAVNRTMINWSRGNWNIVLFTHIPKPKELLYLQVQQSRCITLINKKEWLDQLILNSRDPLSFLLHDLIHADHFFNQSETLRGQLGFYQLIYKIYDYPELKNSLKSDAEFKKEFEYVASDMNAYVIHLFKCFKSAIVKTETTHSHSLFSKIINWWSMPPEIQAASIRLNTPHFSEDDELTLKLFFEKQSGVFA